MATENEVGSPVAKAKLRLAIEMMISYGLTNDAIEAITALVLEGSLEEIRYQISKAFPHD